LIICCGEGGHQEQAKRLTSILTDAGLKESAITFYVDSPKQLAGQAATNCVRLKRLRQKRMGKRSQLRLLDTVQSVVASVYNALKCIRILFQEHQVLISTGPGIAIAPALAIKLKRGTVIHIETWSRFYTRSFTGMVMYSLADHFLIQNEELQIVYPRATYCGRL